jgi:hypothetical protein
VARLLCRLAYASLLIRLDASGLGHAKRECVFASVPGGTAPRCETAGKPCKSGKATQQPSHTLAIGNAVVFIIAMAGVRSPNNRNSNSRSRFAFVTLVACALRLQSPRSADQENLPLVFIRRPFGKAESAARPLFSGCA